MFSLFAASRRLFGPQEHSTDDVIFRLHYKLTATVILAFSLIVSSHQFFGTPIRCLSRNDVPSAILDTYCWLQTTYSIVGAWNKEVGVDVPYPGVDVRRADEKTVQHAYYQWVGFVLFLQYILFRVPHYLWKRVESGLVRELALDLDSPVVADVQLESKKATLANYFKTHGFRHQVLFAAYFSCLLLSLLNVLGQAVLVDRFLNHQFGDLWNGDASLTRVFPRMSKCNFYKYGSGGGVQTYDVVCLLPMNVINEKIYTFLWFWLGFLAVLTFLSVLMYSVMILVKSSRVIAFWFREGLQAGEDLRHLLDHFYVGDWFVLYLLSKNMDCFHFNECVEALRTTCIRSKTTSKTASATLLGLNGSEAKKPFFTLFGNMLHHH